MTRFSHSSLLLLQSGEVKWKNFCIGQNKKKENIPELDDETVSDIFPQNIAGYIRTATRSTASQNHNGLRKSQVERRHFQEDQEATRRVGR